MTTPRDSAADDSLWQRPDRTAETDADSDAGPDGTGSGGDTRPAARAGLDPAGDGGSDAAGTRGPSASPAGPRVSAQEEALWGRPRDGGGSAGFTGAGPAGAAPAGQAGAGPAGAPRGLGDPPANMPEVTGYTGPPPKLRPPPGWQPPLLLRAQPPRMLPPQDEAAVDRAEDEARKLTYGVGVVAGVVVMVLIVLLCSGAFS